MPPPEIAETSLDKPGDDESAATIFADWYQALLGTHKMQRLIIFRQKYFKKPSSDQKRREIAASALKHRQICGAAPLVGLIMGQCLLAFIHHYIQKTFGHSERSLDCPTALLVWPHKVHSQS